MAMDKSVIERMVFKKAELEKQLSIVTKAIEILQDDPDLCLIFEAWRFI